MKRRRSRKYLILALALGQAYLLLFPHPLGKESYFRPIWLRRIPPAAPAPAGPGAGETKDNAVSWFRAGREFGYFRLDGGLAHVGQVLHGVALSDSGFINFPKVAENFVFLDPWGRFQYSVRGYGYPVLDRTGQNLYSISTDLTGLKRLDRDGEVLWSAGFYSPITTLSVAKDECAVGLLDGTLKLIDAQGSIAKEFAPQASRISVILGAALSGDGGQLAVLSGIDPQRLSLLRTKGAELVLRQAMNLPSDFRRAVQLAFTEDGRFLAFEDEQGLSVLDLKRWGRSRLPLEGRVLGLASSAADGLLAVGLRADGGSALKVLRPLSSLLYSGGLPAQDLFLRFTGSSLILGFSGHLLRIDFQEG